MVRTKELLKIAENQGIVIGYHEFCGWPKGVYIRDDKLRIIGIDSNLTPTEERCVLAEEIGHHFTLPMGMDLGESHRYGILKKRIEYEIKARGYAACLLMPRKQWLEAISKSDTTVEELMTIFDVTREMVFYRLDVHFFGMAWVNPYKHLAGIPSERLDEEISILKDWLIGIKKKMKQAA